MDYYSKYKKYKSKYINLLKKNLIGGAIPKNEDAKIVIIDTDPGIDDSMALLLALGSRELNVIAITTVFGNHPDVKKMTDNAMKILDLAKCSSIPVYQGCGMPLTGYADAADYVEQNRNGATQSMRIHGESGIGDKDVLHLLPQSRAGPSEGHAVEKIIELVKEYPNQITLITLGPLTNLARVLQTNPEIGSQFKEVIIMGGALFAPRGHSINTPDANLGNAKSSVEANFMKDSEAADIVFSQTSSNPFNQSIIPPEKLILIPLDTTTQTDYLTSGLIDFLNTEDIIKKFLYNNHKFYVNAYVNIFKRKIVPLHDSCAIFFAMQPQNFEQRHLIDVRIDLGSPATRGRTIIDNRTEFNLPGVDKWTARATYFEIINKDALYASIRESINTLVENSKGN